MLSSALRNAFLNLVPQATYTKKLAEELIARARWDTILSLLIRVGGFSQQEGGPLGLL